MKHHIKALIAACMLVLIASSAILVAFAANAYAATAISTGSAEKSVKKNGVHVDVFSLAATVLGKTADEVKAAVKDGRKIGDLLIASGKLEAFKTAYLAELKAKLSAAVAAGALTKTEADSKYAEKKTEIDAYDGTTSLKGEKAKGGAEHKNGFVKKNSARVDVLSVAAVVLGKTKDEVKDAVKGGSKIGDLLIASGKVEAFKTAYLAELKTKLDAAVSAGSLTKAEADIKYAEGKAKMDAYDGTADLCGSKGTHKEPSGKSAPSQS